MAADFPGPVITELEDRITRLQGYLLEVKELKKNSKKLVEEIRTFAESLEENLQFLKKNLPPTVSTKALGTLANDLEEANTFMAEALQRGKFKSLWTDRETRSKLESRRQKLVSAFQLAFIITSLDVTFDGYKKVNNFQERMQELYSVHTSDAAGARTQIQDLLHPLVSRINGQDERLRRLIDYVENGLSRSNAAESTDVQKFFAEVLAAVDELQNDYHLEELMYDPVYTDDLMWDPVKASDGWTYDRWTIVENDHHPYHRSLPDGRSPFTRKPLSVLCDDVTVRQRLYTMEKFRNENLEQKCKEMREKYRITTLELVREGHDGEALERLEHVLTWAPEDAVCRKHRDTISDRLGKLKAAEENLWTTVEVLRPQSKLEFHCLENLWTTVEVLRPQSKLEFHCLEKENSNLQACLSAVQAKMSAMEQELQRLKKEIEVQANSMELKKLEEKDGKENSNLEACLSGMKEEAEAKISESNLEACLSGMKEEAEAKISSLMEDPKSLKKEKEALLNFREEEMRRRKNEAEDKFDSTFMEGTMGFQTAKKKGMKSTAMLPDRSVVAVKILRPTDQNITNFLNEMVLLTGIKHNHLIQLKGCCIRDRKRLLVYEYAENGNLANALWGRGRTCELDWDLRFKISVGIAKGLCYLHEDLQPRIIHRDIKPQNILLDKNFKVKIADFGLALPLNEWSASGATWLQINFVIKTGVTFHQNMRSLA
ncbi:hypothetical protein R1flu_009097 [Riccia fluitans]|uniref:non-specific serine/threonine protein kinase n=1 Tax=Riccia fluitans TaxID=41844 RepID=A0ABD1Z1Y0_9MARC